MSNRNRATDPAIARAPRSKARYNTYRKPAKAAPRRAYQPRTNNISKQLALKIPECSTHYINALFNPFDTPAGVCVPADSFPMPSQKVKTFQRGSFNLGTTGYGYITFAPTPWSDYPSVYYTASNSVGGVNTIATAYTNIANSVNAKLPYNWVTDVNLNKSVQARIVAAGLRVRYSGTEDARQGLYVAYEDQDLGDAGPLSFAAVRDINQSRSKRPSGDGTWDNTVCYSGPVAPIQTEFSEYTYPLSQNLQPTAPTGGTSPYVMYCQGGAGQAVEFEICMHIEYIGRKVQGKTPSHSDAITYGKILETTKSFSAVHPIAPSDTQSGFQKFMGLVRDTLPQLVNVASAVATKNPMAIASAVGGLAYGQSQSRPSQRQRLIMA